jgi:type III restriction enzyme
MNAHVTGIGNRLSLRAPQREALDILARVADTIRLKKGTDPAEALTRLREHFPHVEDFEREFPSLCFALATGVGKTRLMGAFITYLFRAKNLRHFFVLAPNLTIYNKLIADFTPNTPKYVFQGIGEFAVNSPTIITGDNYESGAGCAPRPCSAKMRPSTSTSSTSPRSTARCGETRPHGSSGYRSTSARVTSRTWPSSMT